LAQLTAFSYKHYAPPKILPFALPHLTLQGNTSSTFLLVTGRTRKEFYFLWLINLKFSENKLKIPERKTPTTKPKVAYFFTDIRP
jgi:hypothetical protein